MPEHIKVIVDSMIDPLLENGVITFEKFRKFLDLNPALRALIKQAVKP